MARFYSTTLGSAKTPATRRGTSGSGITTHTRGWNVGIHVAGIALDADTDVFHVDITGGSGNGHGPTVITVRYSPTLGTTAVFTNPKTGEETHFTL